MSSPNASSSLRPAWRNQSGGRGFQPPPSVASEQPPQQQQQQSQQQQQQHTPRGGRSPTLSGLSDPNSDGNHLHQRAGSGTYSNKFSALDDDEEGLEPAGHISGLSHHHHHQPRGGAAANSRSEGLRHSFGSRVVGGGGGASSFASGGGSNKPSGRSLADLAAQQTTPMSRFGSGPPSSRAATSEEGKVVRFTREKLLSMRPAPPVVSDDGTSPPLPEVLQPLEGNAIIAEAPQDPVCWDTFAADEIWATVPVVTRRPGGGGGKPQIGGGPAAAGGGRSLSEMAEGTGGAGSGNTGLPPRGTGRRGEGGGSSAGRWQRGVALPPAGSGADGSNNHHHGNSKARGGANSKDRETNHSHHIIENPNDLWDDPMSGSAAGDFSAFGDTSTLAKEDGENGDHHAEDENAVFDFEKMTQASQMLAVELHGTTTSTTTTETSEIVAEETDRDGTNNNNSGNSATGSVQKAIDPKRPLASTGTAIRSGSGDDVNVFEDFDEHVVSSDDSPVAVDPVISAAETNKIEEEEDVLEPTEDEEVGVEDTKAVVTEELQQDLALQPPPEESGEVELADAAEFGAEDPSPNNNNIGTVASASGSAVAEAVDATSRLMAMIGVSSSVPDQIEPQEQQQHQVNSETIVLPTDPETMAESIAVDSTQPSPSAQPTLTASPSPWGNVVMPGPSPATTSQSDNNNDKPLDGLSIPLNPWGGGSLLQPSTTSATDLLRQHRAGPSLLQQQSQPETSVVPNEHAFKGLDLSRLRGVDLEQKAREEEMARQQQQRRRQEELEAQKRAAELQQQQAAAVAARQQQRQANVVSQVELVLMERISIILENSWGRSDLMSILATLHAEDTRVIPLLSSIEALRALIGRHSSRVALRHDPAFGHEMAVLLMTNAQWQQQQQQQQRQQQEALNRARRQEEDMRRREQQQRRMEEEQQAASEALRKQQQAKLVIVPGAPWFYSDPQQNIQGPFRGEEMRQWYDAGYFKGDLPVSQDATGPFRLLSELYPDLDLAFMTPDEAKKHNVLQSNHQFHHQLHHSKDEQPSQEAAEQQEARRRAKQEQLERATAAEEAERERLVREATAMKEKRAREAEAAAEHERRMAANAGQHAPHQQVSAVVAEDSHDPPEGHNESSAQLKMMLGLAAQHQQQQHGNENKRRDPGPVASKRPGNKGQNKKTTLQGGTKASQQQQLLSVGPVPSMAVQEASPAHNSSHGAKAAASVWGVSSNQPQTSRKSMSEIQKEEARLAVMQAMQRERSGFSGGGGAGGGGSSGWANVAAASKKTASGPVGSWSGSAAAKLTPAVVVTNKDPMLMMNSSSMPKPTQVLRKQSAGAGTTNATSRAQVANVAAINVASTKQHQQHVAATTGGGGDEFGAKMSPALEKWCKEQMLKLNGTDDLTLVSFCMTLNDPNEIRQYLITYLGSTAQVNNFANEFIHRKVGVKPAKAEEWETTVNNKKKGKKKTSTMTVGGGR